MSQSNLSTSPTLLYPDKQKFLKIVEETDEGLNEMVYCYKGKQGKQYLYQLVTINPATRHGNLPRTKRTR